MNNRSIFPVRVYYEDTDAGGVVYHARYLHFFERARTEFLREKGASQNELIQQQDIAFVVKQMEIDFRYPARLDDLLTVETTLVEVKNASLIFTQKLTKGDQLYCSAKVSIACVKITLMKPTAIPQEIKTLLKYERP
ncbi:hypothetical protein QV08_02245 [Gallibacterium salpingitidis]|uniref:Uncharacterized protein n=1 Tax=Gallibacterium salpingitidis TaxID=505341 RepID=A0A1A7Q368_9PAST|nr:tol-pal system-associated acyl-CoA thioesterase [Gallibacterium salpingitidis]OBW95994.1 hypothetical protein QS62_01870 [Gallibacterium salpingitidis]OBX09283.1 hypothetical protein QV08_02245 [Gallibacterium salpingitidis]OBX11846.1 hypothetical protein QV09_00900 [Gallibacterium salpingitidis]WKT00257.1 tol-pal system-associated acyl-CoA thioesterase [Gallibacterium salpingitidis]